MVIPIRNSLKTFQEEEYNFSEDDTVECREVLGELQNVLRVRQSILPPEKLKGHGKELANTDSINTDTPFQASDKSSDIGCEPDPFQQEQCTLAAFRLDEPARINLLSQLSSAIVQSATKETFECEVDVDTACE